MARSAPLMGLAVLVSRIAGLIRERVFAHFFGVSGVADAWVAALRIPDLLQNLLGDHALTSAFVPTHSRLLGAGQEHEAGRLAGAVASLLTMGVALVVLLGTLAAPLLVSVIAPAFVGEKRALTIHLVRIFFLAGGLGVLSSMCLGILTSHRRFFVPYIVPVLSAAAVITALVLFGHRVPLSRLAVLGAWGAVVGAGLQVLAQLPLLLRVAKGLRPSILVSPDVRRVGQSLLPIALRGGVVRLQGWVELAIASFLATGAVAALGYARLLYSLPISLFAVSITATLLPELARAAVGQTTVADALRTRVEGGLRHVAYLLVPSAVVFLALGDVLSAAIYQTGAFTAEDTRFIWAIIAASAIGLLATTLGGIYAAVFYALHAPQVPLRFAMWRLPLNAALGLALALLGPRLLGIDPKWGVAGLAAATGVTGWLEFVWLRQALHRRLGPFALSRRYLALLWGAGAIGAAVAWGTKALVGAQHPIAVAVPVLTAFGVCYFAITLIAGLPEARAVVHFFRRSRP